MGLKDAPESTLCCISMSVRASTSRVPPLVRDAEIACAESALALAVVQLPGVGSDGEGPGGGDADGCGFVDPRGE